MAFNTAGCLLKAGDFFTKNDRINYFTAPGIQRKVTYQIINIFVLFPVRPGLTRYFHSTAFFDPGTS